MKIILKLVLSLLPLLAYTQNESIRYYTEEYLRYEDFNYKPDIKTVKFHRVGFELSPPMYDLNSTDKLQLSFDELSSNYRTYKYYLIHCDAYWKPSDILESEFMTGINYDDITEYKFSYNTRQSYVHYNLTFPNENIKVDIPGNYLLVVYENDDKEDRVLSRRFYVVEPKVSINAFIKTPTNIDDRKYKQEIDFSIHRNNYEILNPYTDVKIVITQNWRQDNRQTEIKPQIVKGDLLDYNNNGEVVFNGGNEFRNFDIKSTRFQSERIAKIEVDSVSGNYSITLLTDLKRSFKQYITEKDINGLYFVKSDDNSYDSDREADYVYVNFRLGSDRPLPDGDVYVMGGLTDWRFSEENKMVYNDRLKSYICSLLLKQGYYNYQYIFLPTGEQMGDETVIEGTHFETENEYTIYVYNREAGKTFDKLIGLKQIRSHE